MKTDFFPTPPEALKSAAKICIGSTGFAFFQLPAPAGDRWGSVLSRPSFRGGGGKDGTQKQPNKNPTSNKAAGGAKCHRPGSTEPGSAPSHPPRPGRIRSVLAPGVLRCPEPPPPEARQRAAGREGGTQPAGGLRARAPLQKQAFLSPAANGGANGCFLAFFFPHPTLLVAI